MRKLNSKEAKLVDKLLKIAGRRLDIDELLVTDMNDGGMGSLAIGENYTDREFGEQIAEFIFKDFDGTYVSAALNVDSHGNLYELDVWKVDFSPTLDLE